MIVPVEGPSAGMIAIRREEVLGHRGRCLLVWKVSDALQVLGTEQVPEGLEHLQLGGIRLCGVRHHAQDDGGRNVHARHER